ncbi:MAG: hypothetical protein RLY87_2719 [Chloroflexota bacterium]|jgi:uncharacterized membrane protein
MSDESTQEHSQTYRDSIRKRLKRQQAFHKFLTVWFGVSLMLTIIYFLSTPGKYFWPVWPMFGMGIAAFFMWRAAYGAPPKEITDADIDAEILRINGK